MAISEQKRRCMSQKSRAKLDHATAAKIRNPLWWPLFVYCFMWFFDHRIHCLFLVQVSRKKNPSREGEPVESSHLENPPAIGFNFSAFFGQLRLPNPFFCRFTGKIDQNQPKLAKLWRTAAIGGGAGAGVRQCHRVGTLKFFEKILKCLFYPFRVFLDTWRIF